MRRYIVATLALGAALDLSSFIAWGSPAFASWIFFVPLILVLIAALLDVRAGGVAVILELLFGSQGRLLVLDANGLDISLRMGLFAVVLATSVWHLRRRACRRMCWNALRLHPCRWAYSAFALTLLTALVIGYFTHPFNFVFIDANAWLFLFLTPAMLLAFRDERSQPTWVAVLLSGAAYLIVRSYVLFFLFSHDLGGSWIPLYEWVRDTRLGEITVFSGGYPRVFLQSMVLLLPVGVIAGRAYLAQPSLRARRIHLALFGGSAALLIASLSRSFWMGIAALILLGSIALCRSSLQRRQISLRPYVLLAVSSLVSVVLVAFVVHLPYPKPLTTTGLSAALAARFASDEAVGNRWQQLEPLATAIAEQPVFGHGFGATVSYETKDPRTRAAFPSGVYTTTAFEWGYLDDLLERGFLGLVIEFWLIIGLVGTAWKRAGVVRSLGIGLFAIAVVHATSPYLNHPLGLGLIMLTLAATARRDRELPTQDIGAVDARMVSR